MAQKIANKQRTFCINKTTEVRRSEVSRASLSILLLLNKMWAKLILETSISSLLHFTAAGTLGWVWTHERRERKVACLSKCKNDVKRQSKRVHSALTCPGRALATALDAFRSPSHIQKQLLRKWGKRRSRLAHLESGWLLCDWETDQVVLARASDLSAFTLARQRIWNSHRREMRVELKG